MDAALESGNPFDVPAGFDRRFCVEYTGIYEVL